MYIWTHAKHVWLRGLPNLTPRSSALLPVCITTARRPDHIRLSALVRSRSTQFIVHASSQLGHGPPKRGHFSAILAGLCVCVCACVCVREEKYALWYPFASQLGHPTECACVCVCERERERECERISDMNIYVPFHIKQWICMYLLFPFLKWTCMYFSDMNI